MKIGMNLLLWTTHVTEAQHRLFPALKAVGFDGVEVPIFEGDPAHYTDLGRRLDDEGLERTVVGICPDAAHNPISENPTERQAALDHLKWLIDNTAAVGGQALVGPLHQTLGWFTGAGPTDQQKDWAVAVLTQAADHAAPANITLAAEPLNRFECFFLNTLADGATLTQRVNRPNFGVLYDTFHSNIEEKNQGDAIRAGIDAIAHVHISECDRGTPGRGAIDWPPIFRALRHSGYDGWLTIESFGRALPDLAAATKVWRDLFTSEEDVYTHGFQHIRTGWDAAAPQ